MRCVIQRAHGFRYTVNRPDIAVSESHPSQCAAQHYLLPCFFIIFNIPVCPFKGLKNHFERFTGKDICHEIRGFHGVGFDGMSERIHSSRSDKR